MAKKENSNCCLTLTEMCKGAHKTHKRSGAQAQAKRLKPQNGIKELKEFKEKKMAKMKKERSHGLDKRDQKKL